MSSKIKTPAWPLRLEMLKIESIIITTFHVDVALKMIVLMTK